jgi:hypothetical protein
MGWSRQIMGVLTAGDINFKLIPGLLRSCDALVYNTYFSKKGVRRIPWSCYSYAAAGIGGKVADAGEL